jgi:serine/threonine-protein kinase
MAALNKTEVREAGAELHGQLAGEYRIVRKLGSGGFGTVYEAEHPLLKRRAAVKVLHANPAMDSVAVQRFIEEARSASQIRHRHIVDIFSFGTLPNGQYFYVMDLLEGAPLDRYLKEQGKFAPEIALPLLWPIARAVDALHAASIVHRDLKPGNIFLSWESNGEVVPKLLDFGLVKLLSNPVVHTASGVPMGTPYYMSPEQCRGEKIDARADVYSFGVICHELFTGQVPFSGDSATAVLVAHVLHQPPRMSEACPGLSPDLDEPVLRMLSKDPEHRFSSVGAALEALERAARTAGVTMGDGMLWLPRPVSKPPVPSFESDATDATHATSERSGMRSGSRDPGGKRWAWAIGGLLALALALAAVEAYRTGSASRAPATDQVVPIAMPASSLLPKPAPPSMPATPATPAAPLVAVPVSVSLTLRGAPPGAAVLLGDRQLGTAPGPIAVPYGEQPLQLSVSAPGFGPKTVTVTPNAALDVVLTPDKHGRGQSPKRGVLPRDLENPF